ncbi:MAG: hypothetical protein ABSB68_10115 [Acidimicrobiales bacterium]|jgi:hypothetical protein
MSADFVERAVPFGTPISPRLRELIDDKTACNAAARPVIVCADCQEPLGWLLKDGDEQVLVALILSTPAPDPARRDRRPQPQRLVAFIERQPKSETPYWDVECNRYHHSFICRNWLDEQSRLGRRRAPSPRDEDHVGHHCGVLVDDDEPPN